MAHVINIAKDYTPNIGGRYIEDGEGNATEFREKFLVPLLKKNEKIIIELDGVAGYASSFIDEAFGGLVRDENFSTEFVLDHIELSSLNGAYEGTKMRIVNYIKNPDEVTWK